MNNNKPKSPAAKKKSTPPTKPLTPAKKAGGGKRRPALNRPTKKAKRLEKNPATRAMLEGFVKEALKDGLAWLDRNIVTRVLRACLRKNLEAPDHNEVLELLVLMFRQGKLVRVGSDRYQLPEQEAPPTTPSGKHEVITAGCATEGEDQAVQEDRVWVGKVRKVRRALGSAEREFLLRAGPNATVDTADKEPEPARPNRLKRFIQREKNAMLKRISLSDREHQAAVRLRALEQMTPETVVQALTPVSDVLADLLVYPNVWPQEAMLSLDFVLPSELETFFDRVTGERPIYLLRWTLIQPMIVGRVAEDVLFECRSESPLGCAHHFLAHVEHFVHYGAKTRKGAYSKQQMNEVIELKADVLGACAKASKTLQGAVLDNALRFFK